MRIHQLSPLDAVASLKSAAEGSATLKSSADSGNTAATSRGSGPEPLWLRLLAEFITFFSVILWVAAGLAFIAEWSDPAKAWPRWAMPS